MNTTKPVPFALMVSVVKAAMIVGLLVLSAAVIWFYQLPTHMRHPASPEFTTCLLFSGINGVLFLIVLLFRKPLTGKLMVQAAQKAQSIPGSEAEKQARREWTKVFLTIALCEASAMVGVIACLLSAQTGTDRKSVV